MRRADVRVRIRREIVQIDVEKTNFQTVVPIPADIRIAQYEPLTTPQKGTRFRVSPLVSSLRSLPIHPFQASGLQESAAPTSVYAADARRLRWT